MKNLFKKINFQELLSIFISYALFESIFILAIENIIAADVEVFFDFTAHTASFLIYSCLYYLLKFLTTKPFLSFCINSSLLYMLGFISIIKTNYLGFPVLLSDINFIQSVNEISSFINIKEIIQIITIPILLFSILAFVIPLRFNYLATKNKKVSKRIRKLLITLLLITFILFEPTFKFLTQYNLPQNNIAGFYLAKGFYSGMYGHFLNQQIKEPDNYSEENINKILTDKTNNDSNSGKWGTPNVIVILSEAFWNTNNITEVTFSKNIMESYNKVKENSISIDMLSPTYAGLTTNVEYEFITGESVNFFVENYIPFNSLYTSQKFDNYVSNITTLNNSNYQTEIYSPFDNGRVYNVSSVYKHMGFNNIYLKNDLIQSNNIKGDNISDEYLYQVAKDRLEEEDKNLFLFLKTAQNHMPYKDNKYTKFDFDVISSSLSDEETFRTQIFAQGIYDASNELLKLYDYIKTFEEPTIVVFFGDHLPSLTTAYGDDIPTKLSALNSSDLNKNLFKKYNTEALIFANFDIEKPNLSTLSFDGLSSYIMHNLNIEHSNQTEWLYNNLEEYVFCNHYICSDINGNLYQNNISNEIWNIKKQLQYYNIKNLK